MSKKEIVAAYIKWAFPDGFDILAYCLITLVTILLSNLSSLNSLFHYADIKIEILDKISDYLNNFMPRDWSANLSVLIFWLLVGLLVYLLISLASKFTSDLKDDLEVNKYVYPAGMDKYARLKHFLLTNAEKILGVGVLIIYMNLLFSHFLPQWSDVYKQIIWNWSYIYHSALGLMLTILAQFVMLHGLVIILRLIVFRKRILGL